MKSSRSPINPLNESQHPLNQSGIKSGTAFQASIVTRSSTLPRPDYYSGTATRLSLKIACLGIALSIAGLGCNKTAEPPAPLAVESAPEGLKQTFKDAPKASANTEKIKSIVDDVTIALQSKEYARALTLLDILSGLSDLSDQQREFATRSMMAAQKALAEQAAGGNNDALRALEMRRATK